MKRWKYRAMAGLLAAAVLGSAVLAAETPGSTALKLADSLSLTGGYTQFGSDMAGEQILSYTPGGDIRPMVVYGSTLYGRSTMDYIEDYMAEQGYTTAAAMNGAFFDFATGIPYGMVVTDGILRSSGDTQTVCIWEDGSMEIGKTGFAITLLWQGEEIALNYNKAMTKNNGYCLYSADYDTQTKHSLEAYNLILRPERAELKVSDQVQATVIEVLPGEKTVAIPDGCFVLSLAEETDYATAMEQMKRIAVGDTVLISTVINRGYESIRYAFGGGDILVENGNVQSSFTLDSAEKPAARTALGIKSNGDVVCYTADKGDHSGGLTLAQLARRMKELGCVKAVNLDGGGSTTVGATLPGLTEFTTVNDPADGSQRPCANFLFFVRPTVAAGQAVRLHVYPYDAAVLRGGQVELDVAASDGNYMAAAVPGDVTLTAVGGTVSGNVFTAQKTGIAEVKASAGTLTGSTTIHVVETPTSMTVRREDQDTALETLVVESGESVDLTADAEYLGLELAAEDYAFNWYVPQELGRISDDGVFTASENNITGDLMVTCGDLRIMIPVEIKANPFADTKGHWARSYITELFYQGVLQGSADGEGKMYYRPDDSMTRQEFVVAMMRAQDVDLANYQAVELPFADADKIADWAVDAVKAAYELGYFTGSGKGNQLYAEPTSTITREAAMTILARTISAASDSDVLESFTDADKVSAWAKSALTAMVEREIINGMDGKLQPQGKVTRAQVAKMIYAMQ